MKNEIIHNLAHSINDRNISNYCQRCKLWRLEGVVKKSIINIIHWKLYGTLPELKNI